MKKILILKPRLDLPFKRFSASVADNSLPEIRTYWERFVTNLADAYLMKNDKVHVVESPRWQFSKDVVEFFNPDIAYIPHTEQKQFKGGPNCLYYMQTVHPELFTVDYKGWGGGSGFSSFKPTVISKGIPDDYGEAFDHYREQIKQNKSKFAQPAVKDVILPENYIFVPLQLPHDETIKFHSNVSVEEFTEALCKWSEVTGVHILFKGHPVNIASMAPLKKIISQYPDTTSYVENISIHTLIERSSAVYIINSGTGMEAMLHDKPVVAFGKAEYSNFVMTGNIHSLTSLHKRVLDIDMSYYKSQYRLFYNWFVNRVCHHCDRVNLFRLL